jgi:predicted nucleic acid-binding protein
VPQTSLLFRAALQRYRERTDQAWSLTDCASFVVKEERGLRRVLTSDHHFEQAGFEALLR